ncbi:MAG: Mut7-C RNAse domain-containing protein [Candidatus Omnitrophota bacterium]
METIRFIALQELGKLAKWLRILGYDCGYYDKNDIADLVIQAIREGRVILARSAAYKKYKGIRVLVVTSDHVEEQVEQVIRELGLPLDEEKLFQRCVECNYPLEDVPKEETTGKVPEYVFRTQEVFKRCPSCGKIFWKGTHWDMVGKWLEKRKF